MIQGARSILLEDRLCGADLDVNNCQIVAQAVMYLPSEPVAFFGGGQLFDLRRVVAQLLVCFCEFGASRSLARRHTSKHDNEYNANAVNDSDCDSVNPPAP